MAVPVGDQAPDFQASTLAGKDFRLSDYRGELILLKIGTTWCPSCKTQTQAIDTIRPFLADNDVRYIDVYIDESAASVTRYFDKGRYQRPTAVVLDTGQAHRAYNVYVIPRLLLIDRDFRVVRDGDALPAGKLKRLVEKYLESD